uniref:Uncharacterized protein n=1 Tax=Nothoprocta perdicaria TaxID=30464 RepID=A0A8C6ZPN7_NOTPE
LNALSVGRASPRDRIWFGTRGSIPRRSPTSALSVRRPSIRRPVSSGIRKSTFVRDLAKAPSVGNASSRSGTSLSTSCFTPEVGPTSGECASENPHMGRISVPTTTSRENSDQRVLSLERPKSGSQIGLCQVPKNKLCEISDYFLKLANKPADCILLCTITALLTGGK